MIAGQNIPMPRAAKSNHCYNGIGTHSNKVSIPSQSILEFSSVLIIYTINVEKHANAGTMSVWYAPWHSAHHPAIIFFRPRPPGAEQSLNCMRHCLSTEFYPIRSNLTARKSLDQGTWIQLMRRTRIQPMATERIIASGTTTTAAIRTDSRRQYQNGAAQAILWLAHQYHRNIKKQLAPRSSTKTAF